MSAGIYMNNGVLAYSMNLEKKLKRRVVSVVPVKKYTAEEVKKIRKHTDYP